MVAASKMRKAQQAALAGRPYVVLMNSVLGQVSANAGDFSHPLIEKRAVKKRAMIVISSDKGLAGALNSNLLREVAKTEPSTTVYIAAGRKGAQFLGRTKRNLVGEFSYKDAPQFSEARAISRFAQDLFLKGEVDQVDVVYTNYINTLTQMPEVRTLMPIGEIKTLEAEIEGDSEQSKLASTATEYIFEPDAGAVLGALLPHYLNYQVYQMLLEAKASEHSARMVAMKNATDNAKQLIKDLTLDYNKIRQASITSELLEITSAAMSMG